MNTPQLTTIKRVELDAHHHASLSKHTISDGEGTRDFPPFVKLVIAAYPGEKSCYLFHVCADGQVADTWHETVEDALYQAEWEFGVTRDEWTTPHAPENF
jgi:hypothetical protein